MAKEMTYDAAAAEQEKNKLKEEKKQLKKEQKAQRKEAKRRAAEIAKQEEALGEDSGNGVVTLFATLLIVILWLAVICVVVKLDIGGFGSGVLTPILKDVPVLNKILPGVDITETTEPDNYGGYSSLEEAVAYIMQLELELERVQTASNAKDMDIETLKAEVRRLQEFEQRQDDFQRIKTAFYEEVVETLGPEEFEKYFASMDPTTAEYIYRQVLIQNEASKEIQSYVQAYSAMKPKEAAKIFDSMTENFALVAKILEHMDAESRGKILASMDVENAARLTKMMDPDS